MAFTGIGKLIKDLVTGTPADTDYFAFGNTDLKKVSFPNLKKALGIDALNSALVGIRTHMVEAQNVEIDRKTYQGSTSIIYIELTAQGRIFCIGFVYGSTNGEVWARYINQTRILTLINAGGEGEKMWLSIRAGLDN